MTDQNVIPGWRSASIESMLALQRRDGPHLKDVLRQEIADLRAGKVVHRDLQFALLHDRLTSPTRW
jgi:hypothetical protein